jgi:hypothetical protein
LSGSSWNNLMLKSYTGFQRLRKCVVGRSYPPEFYSWITNPRLRLLFETIADETEEDYLKLIKKLKEFNIDVIRPDTLENIDIDVLDGSRIPGPYSMTPRDSLCMIGETLYQFDTVKHANKASGRIERHRDNRKVYQEYLNLVNDTDFFLPIKNYVKSFNNKVITPNELPDLVHLKANGIIRLGENLYLGANKEISPATNTNLQKEFRSYKVKSVNSEGHVDGVLCPVKPGLLMSIIDPDIQNYNDTFPGWEVCWLKGEGWEKVKAWHNFKKKTNGKWWIKGYEQDNELIDFVQTWLKDWVGYVEETVFDVNALIIDEKNIIVSGYNKVAFDTFERHGITPHVVPFRHRYFWDGGIHCNTLDLDRDGDKINYFTKEI